MRYLIGAVHCFTIIMLVYTLRVVVNIAVSKMTVPAVSSAADTDSCPYEKGDNQTSSQPKEALLSWSHHQVEMMFSSFYIGYIFFQLPGGFLCDKIGARWVCITIIVGSAVITLATPITVKYTYWGMFALRVLMGFIQGPLYPAVSNLLSTWVPREELSTIGSIAYLGSTMGTVLCNSISGVTLHYWKWSITFYQWALANLIYLVFFFFHVFSSPATHPFLTQREKEYLEGKLTPPTVKMWPWKEVFKDVPVYAIICGQFSHDYIFYTLQTNLPTFMDKVLHFNIKKTGWFSSVPWVLMCIAGIVTGVICDYLIKNNKISLLNARRIAALIGTIPSSICLLMSCYVGCSPYVIVALFCASAMFKGCYFAGGKVNMNDITKRYGGCLMGVANGLGTLAGILVPYVVALITTKHTLGQWRLVFWINFGVTGILITIYVLFTSGDRRPWDYLEGEEIPEDIKKKKKKKKEEGQTSAKA